MSMEDRLKPLALQLELNERLFLNAIQDFPQDRWLRRLEETANHAAFLALHLLDARCFMLRLLGLAVFHGFEEVGEDATRLEDISEFPPPMAVAESWRRVNSDVGSALEEMDPEALESRAPNEFPVDDITVFGAIAFLVQHEAYHLGQLGIIRRAVGLAPLSYS
jgi:uncharacterized damage-inducible protein DinB